MTSGNNQIAILKAYYTEVFVKKLTKKLSEAEYAFLQFFEKNCRTAPSALAIAQASTLQSIAKGLSQ